MARKNTYVFACFFFWILLFFGSHSGVFFFSWQFIEAVEVLVQRNQSILVDEQHIKEGLGITDEEQTFALVPLLSFRGDDDYEAAVEIFERDHLTRRPEHWKEMANVKIQCTLEDRMDVLMQFGKTAIKLWVKNTVSGTQESVEVDFES